VIRQRHTELAGGAACLWRVGGVGDDARSPRVLVKCAAAEMNVEHEAQSKSTSRALARRFAITFGDLSFELRSSAHAPPKPRHLRVHRPEAVSEAQK